MIPFKLDYYLFTLIKRNIVYIVAFIIFINLSAFVVPNRIVAYKSLRQKMNTTRTEINKLLEQKALVDKYTAHDLDSLVQLLNTVVPEKYDFFTVYSAIAELEKNSGLKFISFSPPAAGFTQNGVSMSVSAQGSLDSILNFLKNYKTIGGRVVDIDLITIKPKESQVDFVLNFYASPSKIGSSLRDINPQTLQAVRQLGQKIELAPLIPIPTIPIVPKTNPFSQ